MAKYDWLDVFDANMLHYFLIEKGDVRRYAGWEALVPKLQEHCPELLKALQDLDAAKRVVTLIVEDLYNGAQ